MKNYYEILGVEEKAELKEIKKAYHRLAGEFHPDKHQGKETLVEAENKFKEISEAYSILSDPNKKQEYDQMRSGGPFGFRTTGDPFDIFFRQAHAQAQEYQRRAREQVLPGRDVVLENTITLAEALFGAEKSVEYDVASACLGCKGRGAEEFITCTKCNGSGFSVVLQAKTVISSTCPDCSGSGNAPKNICPDCSGRRLVPEHKKLSIKFPPGLSPGKFLRIPGGGGRGINDGPSGNLMIKVDVSYPDLTKLSEEDRSSLSDLLTKSSS